MQPIDACKVLQQHGMKPSQQRIAIMQYLLTHCTHPTVEDVYQGLIGSLPTLSRTTVYNTLRMFSEHNAAQMLTIDERHVCYDGDTHPHSHFFCRKCGRLFDMMDDEAPTVETSHLGHGFFVDEVQLYYKGLCPTCASASTLSDYAEA